MATKKKLLQAAAGSAGGASLNVEEVFSTYLYTGTGSTLEINNGIDLSGEGGLVWQKVRSTAGYRHFLFDTERTFNKFISTNTTDAESNQSALSSFDSDGVTLTSNGNVNGSGIDSVLWTFRKAPKFFDVVTYTGDGTEPSAWINHNLGSTPGSIWIKRTDSTSNWFVWHRGLAGRYENLYLNQTGPASTNYVFDNTTNGITDTQFRVWFGGSNLANISGATYVAYLFAHNDGDGEFGPDGDADIIKCGSYTGNGSSTGPVIDLGFEPQWILLKGASASSSWLLYDTMRGMTVGTTNAGPDALLFPHSSGAEYTDYHLSPTPTGFQIRDAGGNTNTNGNTYIYIAIRRGPMAVPESATDVFDVAERGADSPPPLYRSGFVTDMFINRADVTLGGHNYVLDRLRGELQVLLTAATDAEAAYGGAAYGFDVMDGIGNFTGLDSNNYSWMWKRAPNFFDVVAYTGTGSAMTINHNLGVTPEMIWTKRRDSTGSWIVYHSATGLNNYLLLNSTAAVASAGNYYAVSDTTFGAPFVNSGGTFISYLFASLDGVSKVGSFTYTQGVAQNIDCGFSSGARFVLYKRTSGTSGWTVFDTERGIVAGNDPMLFLNTTSAEDSSYDFIDPYSGGFALSDSTANLSGDYIFYAIA